MVYTYGFIDIIIKRSALDRNQIKNSDYLIAEHKIEEGYYDCNLVCVAGGMSPGDAKDSVSFLEAEYNIRIHEKKNGKLIARDGVVINGPFGPTTECDWIRPYNGGWSYVQPINNPNPQWDTSRWVESFKIASANKNKNELHRLRAMVFINTMQIVTNGGYILNGKKIQISDPPDSILFDREIRNLKPIEEPGKDRIIRVLNEDCLLTARKLADKNPLVLNMASRRNPGGGVETGAGAQEECLFRSSNYYRTLYPLRTQYPMDRNFGGIYSPNVTAFRGLESDGYPLLEEPFKTNFVAVAALARPDLAPDGSYTPEDKRAMENKIRTILNIAAMFHHKVLILSAFGCGAFKNPPRHVAMLFKTILDEPAYKNRFEEVYFSIKPDHNDISENCRTFLEVFKAY